MLVVSRPRIDPNNFWCGSRTVFSFSLTFQAQVGLLFWFLVECLVQEVSSCVYMNPDIISKLPPLTLFFFVNLPAFHKNLLAKVEVTHRAELSFICTMNRRSSMSPGTWQPGVAVVKCPAEGHSGRHWEHMNSVFYQAYWKCVTATSRALRRIIKKDLSTRVATYYV